ncbi:MAG: hypothetical protein BWK80_56290 [Desulfobacteraceae bacterium IS3]|nr:MAG: hypothetical protein BWK80_56290 [Desulfobacteraceae bacterium IS3]
MLKKMIKVGCAVLALGILSVPAWSSDNLLANSNDLPILAKGGHQHGPGDGTGNGGSGPRDGSGNGPGLGGCTNLESGTDNDFMILARGGRGNGGGTGTGTGGGSRGNGGVCPYGLN